MQKSASRAKAKPSPKPYHHGDLKPAVLAAAEKILETEGVDALTLRAVARMVGVSHTAPKNHFGDLEGLLSELAAVGYGRFGAALLAAMESAGADPRRRPGGRDRRGADGRVDERRGARADPGHPVDALLVAVPAGAVAEGGDLRPPPARRGRLRRLRRRYPTGPRAPGRGRVPHREPHVLLHAPRPAGGVRCGGGAGARGGTGNPRRRRAVSAPPRLEFDPREAASTTQPASAVSVGISSCGH